ncbi:hypothetical protein G9A89_010888 [Geosiphon pyriformis]|nr:hypothetical protein G9A89_010888 [Geosiphon pyriformis]
MASAFIESAFYPSEIVALFHYKFLPASSSSALAKTLRTATKSKIRCYEFLNMTSRSFAAVIQELNDELRDAVCLFYLILRGLDTIEDDMSIPIDKKEVLLRNFHNNIYKRGWNFKESGPKEKDRQLLMEFDLVIEEFLSLKKCFQNVIAEKCKLMGHGMADFANNASYRNYGVKTVKDYDLYCHYVAGLVGLGLSDLFIGSGLENDELSEVPDLSKSMGLFLQKVNIIRDYLEDILQNRRFWPKEIWSQYVDNLADLKEPGHEKQAIECLSAMCLDALKHVPDCLTYMNMIRDPKIFNFCAIPQVMAIATLALVFKNYNIYKKVVKIRKGEAVKLIQKSTNIYAVVGIFRQYTQTIITKNDAKDPNFLRISIACGQIEQWCQTYLKSHPFSSATKTLTKSTPKQELNFIDAQLFILFIVFLLATICWIIKFFGLEWELLGKHLSFFTQ